MSVIITENGFQEDTFEAGFQPVENWEGTGGVDLPNTTEARDVIDQISEAPIVRIEFPKFADGRGFTIARRLRQLGYRGRLRAHGHILADQFVLARRVGFDEVEISDELAERQPEHQWRLDPGITYQDRLTTAL